MATESGEGFSPHVRGVTVTTLATTMGVAAGVGSALLASGPTDRTGLFLMIGALLLQLPVLHLLGIDVSDFGIKDNLYVAFMTFAMWFVTWGLLLTAGAGL
ncbi:MAG: hypothetical protein V5A13_11235 [Haloarculaceae archaeon]